MQAELEAYPQSSPYRDLLTSGWSSISGVEGSSISFLGRGNTGGDAVIYVPDAKVP